MILLLSVAGAGVAIAPSDGVGATGPRIPAWAIFGAEHPPRSDLGALSLELELAWRERRSLENASARRRVDAVVDALRPTLDAGERDLLQRALFLRGILDIDDVGSVGAVPDAVVVDEQPVPRAWVEAVSVSPGAPAPATADAAFAAHLYEQARTALVQAGGLTLDLSAPGAGEVRVDGLPVSQEITLLPGRHAVTWHPVGRSPVVLDLSVGGAGPEQGAAALRHWLSDLEAAQRGERPLDPAVRRQLRDALEAPAVLLSTARPATLVWLVDGPERWGHPALGVGLSIGAWAYSSGEPPAVACDGRVSTPTESVGDLSLEGSLTTGPLRFRVGGGVAQFFQGGLAAVVDGECPSGLNPNVDLVATFPLGWASAGGRLRLSSRAEVEPFLRVGGTSAFAIAQLGASLHVGRGLPTFDLRVSAGPAVNLWSGGEARTAFFGGVETVTSLGTR